jgi:hypothetical protein
MTDFSGHCPSSTREENGYMRYGIPSRACIVAAAALIAACDRKDARDIEKERREAAEEIARIQREADQKVAEARREADRKIAEVQREAQKDIAKEQKEASRDVAEERRDLEGSLKDAKQDTKEQYTDYAKKRLRLLELEAADVRATAAPDAGARADFDQQMKNFDTKRQAVQREVSELDKAPPDKWAAMKPKIETQLDQLEKELEAIDKKY